MDIFNSIKSYFFNVIYQYRIRAESKKFLEKKKEEHEKLYETRGAATYNRITGECTSVNVRILLQECENILTRTRVRRLEKEILDS